MPLLGRFWLCTNRLRNHALLLTYFLTAGRSHEILPMRRRDLRPSRAQPDTLIWTWRGKGGKQADIPLPARAHHAIVHYLTLAHRHLGDLDPDHDYIWAPIVTHGSANLASAVHRRPPRPHISSQNAVRILQTALRNAGIADWRQFRIHDLRHSFAHLFHGDLETLRRILHHESLATTGIYLAALRDPIDDYSESVWQTLGL